jgi:hypothetical protein
MFASNPFSPPFRRFHVKVAEGLWRSGDKVSPASSRIPPPQHKEKQKPTTSTNLPEIEAHGPNSIFFSIPISEKKQTLYKFPRYLGR